MAPVEREVGDGEVGKDADSVTSTGAPQPQPVAPPAGAKSAWEHPLLASAWGGVGAKGSQGPRGGQRWEVKTVEGPASDIGGTLREGKHYEAAMFMSMQFVGDWMDSLGHRIMVLPSGVRGGKEANNRKRGKGGGRGAGKGKGEGEGEGVSAGGFGFLAKMQKPGMPEKCFTIANDRGDGKEWTCGNGALVKEESSTEVLVWLTKDGRKSQWTRAPPLGAVYFDPLPGLAPMYFDSTVIGSHVGSGAPQPAQWNTSEEPTPEVAFTAGKSQSDAKSTKAEQEVNNASVTEAAAGGATWWNSSAPEFMPPSMLVALAEASRAAPEPACAATEAAGAAAAASAQSSSSRRTPEMRATAKASPTMRPLLMPVGGSPWTVPKWGWGRTPSHSPQLGPAATPALDWSQVAGAAPVQELARTPIAVLLLMESPDIVVSGPRLEWCLPDAWGKLRDFPRDFCVTSPMFGVQQAGNMQLAFYPNGSRTAELDHCTVVLTRGPDSAGIKFEFLVNGRGIGPKVCLGRRYLGDYPLPFDKTDENAPKHVVVTMKVLDILGA